MNSTAAVRTAALDPEAAWQQLLNRDASASFFYGVLTTGVFCRPGCGSRRPLRQNVRFFATIADATRAGFRPCTRCKPQALPAGDILQKLRAHIESHLDRPILLHELGRIAGLSPFTVQRQFKQAFGVSPLQYQRALRAGMLRSQLKNGASVTNAIYNAGFNSSSRAYHDAPLGMTPSRFAAGGRGERIRYSTALSPLGWMIVGATERGICWLALADTESKAEQTLRDEFPAATLLRDNSSALVDAVIAEVNGATKEKLAPPQVKKLASPQLEKLAPPQMAQVVDLRGTAFQLRVWEALRRIPRGQTRSYSQLAADLGNPKATRAVARACATNRVAVLVPCHRVVGVNANLTGYRWGVARKRALLEAEKSRRLP